MTAQGSQSAIVIGAGLSGLLTSRALLDKGLDVTLVGMPDTRHQTLCAWRKLSEPPRFPEHLMGQWQQWGFSHGKSFLHQESSEYCYEAVDGLSLKCALEREFDAHEKGVRSKVLAIDIVKDARYFTVSTESANIQADLVFDSRPPSFCENTMVQQFAGIAVHGRPKRQLDAPLLMAFDHEHPLEDALVFIYVLPLADGSYLVEATLFGNNAVPDGYLESVALEWACVNIDGFDKTMSPVFSESGILPMGPVMPQSVAPAIGVASGSARMSSGYSLSGLERQLQNFALSNETATLSANPYSRASVWMDTLFLKVLSNNPRLGREMFLAMAESLSGDAFARFMLDRFTLGDALRVVAAMPKRPFIRALCQS